ncbi:MAG: hypothetical protein KJP14_10865 [Eudoraea sp.]|nr:hypothetical protein [Eudoraea sp.]
MHTRLLSLLIVGFLVIYSCKEAKNEKELTKMEEVMAIHDEVMPEMSTISKLVAELKPLADSTATGQDYDKAMKDLQAAHKSMMDWMAGFGERFDHEEIMEGKALSEEKQKWLLEEEEKAKVMRDQILSSISQAQALLEKN